MKSLGLRGVACICWLLKAQMQPDFGSKVYTPSVLHPVQSREDRLGKGILWTSWGNSLWKENKLSLHQTAFFPFGSSRVSVWAPFQLVIVESARWRKHAKKSKHLWRPHLCLAHSRIPQHLICAQFTADAQETLQTNECQEQVHSRDGNVPKFYVTTYVPASVIMLKC